MRKTLNKELTPFGVFFFTILGVLFFGLINFAGAITSYPPGSLLQPNDVTSSHIRNATIVDVDVSASAAINTIKLGTSAPSGSIFYSDGSGVASSTSLKYDAAGNNLYVLGGRAHASSTNFNGVNYTWPSADGTSGQALKTDGAGTLSFGNVSASAFSNDFIAGTDVNTGMAVYVATTTATTTTHFLHNTITQNGLVQGTGGTNEKKGQTISSASIIEVSGIKAGISKVGTPTDNLIVTIEADVAGAPSGTALATLTLAGANVNTTDTLYEYSFGNTIWLDAGRTYWIVCARSGARDTGNYFRCQYDNTDLYSGGAYYTLDNSAWGAVATSDMTGYLVNAIVANKVYPTNTASSSQTAMYVGLVNATTTKEGTVTVTMSGISTASSTWIGGTTYYLNGIHGAISTAQASIVKKVGTAISTSKLWLSDLFE